MIFKERMIFLLMEKNISNADIARATGISSTRISNFCNGIDIPSLENALLLINYFRCTFDYLFCVNEHNTFIAEVRVYSQNIFLSQLNILLKKNNISQRKLCREVHIDKSCITNWRHGQNPKPKNLVKIANILNTSVDYLLGFNEV